jgi:hypothetical protein
MPLDAIALTLWSLRFRIRGQPHVACVLEGGLFLMKRRFWHGIASSIGPDGRTIGV